MSKKAHQIYWTSQVETKSIDSFEEFIGLGFCRLKKILNLSTKFD